MYFELQILITVVIHINAVLHYFITLSLENSHNFKTLLYSLSPRQTEKFNTNTSTNITIKTSKYTVKFLKLINFLFNFQNMVERQNIH